MEPGSAAKREVPTKDYGRQYAPILDEVLAAFRAALLEDKPILGRAVEEFERAFAAYLGVEHVVGLNSGTDALVLGLRGLGIGPGDEVIIQANTFLASISAVEMVGAKPVLVDCRAGGPEIDLKQAEAAITPATKALMVVHLHGFATPVHPIEELCSARGLLLIEDAAQAHGAAVEGGRRAGSAGAFGAFSFHPSKNLGAFGDGGALVTNDAGLAERLRVLRNLGKEGKYGMAAVGPNTKLDTLQAALLGIKLAHLDEWNARRRELAALYDRELSGLPGLELPAPFPDTVPVYHHYPVLHERRDALRAFLAERGVKSGMHYPVAPHRQPAFAHLGHAAGAFPHAERRAAQGVSLPMSYELHDDEILAAAAGVREFLPGGRA